MSWRTQDAALVSLRTQYLVLAVYWRTGRCSSVLEDTGRGGLQRLSPPGRNGPLPPLRSLPPASLKDVRTVPASEAQPAPGPWPRKPEICYT